MPLTNRELLANTAGSPLQDVILPEFPSFTLPPRVAKAYPELAEAFSEYDQKLNKWRQDANVALKKSAT